MIPAATSRPRGHHRVHGGGGPCHGPRRGRGTTSSAARSLLQLRHGSRECECAVLCCSLKKPKCECAPYCKIFYVAFVLRSTYVTFDSSVKPLIYILSSRHGSFAVTCPVTPFHNSRRSACHTHPNRPPWQIKGLNHHLRCKWQTDRATPSMAVAAVALYQAAKHRPFSFYGLQIKLF